LKKGVAGLSCDVFWGSFYRNSRNKSGCAINLPIGFDGPIKYWGKSCYLDLAKQNGNFSCCILPGAWAIRTFVVMGHRDSQRRRFNRWMIPSQQGRPPVSGLGIAGT